MTALPPLAIIGFGTMGSAIVEGVLRAGLIPPERLVVAETDPARRAAAERLGVVSVAEPAAALSRLAAWDTFSAPGQALLAVKPQMLAEVVEAVRPAIAASPRGVTSILAGVSTARLEAALPGARVVRVMPNLGVRIGKGCTAICLGSQSHDEDAHAARKVFGVLGECVDLPESLMDAFTAVAGSGPAYAFLLAEAMEQGAVRVGFSPEEARRIVRATLHAAADLLDGADPAALRHAVTSKGGTTAAALAVLDDAGVAEAVARAVVAARDRGRELGA